MASDHSIPCPMCGRMNRLDRKTCHTCEYLFVLPSEDEASESPLRRVVSRLVGPRR